MYYVYGMNEKDLILKMFFDNHGNLVSLFKERVTDSIISRKGFTRNEFNTIVTQLAESSYIKITATQYVPLEKTIEYFRKKTFGERLKALSTRYWIGTLILTSIGSVGIKILGDMVLDSMKDKKLEHGIIQIIPQQQNQVIHDTIYVDSLGVKVK